MTHPTLLPKLASRINKRKIKPVINLKYIFLFSNLAFASIANAQEDFVPLFNGVNLDGWYTFDDDNGVNNDVDNFYQVQNGELVILVTMPTTIYVLNTSGG